MTDEIRFGSVCSGIEAASVAFRPLGWRAAWLSEIDKFARSVLAHHYPDVPNHGDMLTLPRRILTGEVEAPDVLCGGTPCQSFSIAGKRESLDDDRGNLTLKYVETLDAIDFIRRRAGKPAAVAIWENVPGVFSTKDNAFGCFLAGLAGEDVPLQPPGRKWANAGCVLGPRRAVAWRTLDAQYFGLAQRRRRVFVVASARAGFDPAQVLFEWAGLRRDSAPSRHPGASPAVGALAGTSPGGGWRAGGDEAAAGQLVPGAAGPLSHNGKAAGSATSQDAELGLLVAGSLTAGMGRRSAEDPERGLLAFGGNNTQGAIDVATAVRAKGGSGHNDFESETFIAHALRADGFDASEDGTGRGTPLVPAAMAFQTSQSGVRVQDTAPTLDANWGSRRRNGVISFDTTQITSAENRSNPQPDDPCHPLAAGAHAPAIAFNSKDHGQDAGEEISPTLRAGAANGHDNAGTPPAVAFYPTNRQPEFGNYEDVSPAVKVGSAGSSGNPPGVTSMAGVRRLMPVECERLQGFPDDYTSIPTWSGWRKMDTSETPESCIAEGLEVKQNRKTGRWRVKDVDGPRYRALGNSWAINVVYWLGRRVDAAMKECA